jgi:hypothetical protein
MEHGHIGRQNREFFAACASYSPDPPPDRIINDKALAARLQDQFRRGPRMPPPTQFIAASPASTRRRAAEPADCVSAAPRTVCPELASSTPRWTPFILERQNYFRKAGLRVIPRSTDLQQPAWGAHRLDGGPHEEAREVLPPDRRTTHDRLRHTSWLSLRQSRSSGVKGVSPT